MDPHGQDGVGIYGKEISFDVSREEPTTQDGSGGSQGIRRPLRITPKKSRFR